MIVLFFAKHIIMEVSNSSLRIRRSKQQILDLLAVFETSDHSVQQFCQMHNINAVNFHKWRSRYQRNTDGKERTPGFAAINVASTPAMLFAEVNNIRIYQPVSASFLKELL